MSNTIQQQLKELIIKLSKPIYPDKCNDSGEYEFGYNSAREQLAKELTAILSGQQPEQQKDKREIYSEILIQILRHFDNDEMTRLIKDLADRLPKEQQQQKEQGWISVKDRLPDDGVEVLINIEFGDVIQALINNSKWRGSKNVRYWMRECYAEDSIIAENVTHWMPLPTPPQEGGAE